MKVIQAMKQVKDLQRKADDLVDKVKAHCADLDCETPVYGTVDQQSATVRGWIQSHSDLMKEILRLRVAIQRTNIATVVEIPLGDKVVKKSIAEWIHRRRDLAAQELKMWRSLTDRGLKETKLPSTVAGVPGTEVKIRRYFNPVQRDENVNLYASEASTIDSSLEVVNAVTDLME